MCCAATTSFTAATLLIPAGVASMKNAHKMHFGPLGTFCVAVGDARERQNVRKAGGKGFACACQPE